jgi:hypothetical protein
MHTNGTHSDLVLEILPNGESAWLRPELDAAIADAGALDAQITRCLGWPENHPALQECIGITQAGRDALARAEALENLLGQPWPSVAEAVA